MSGERRWTIYICPECDNRKGGRCTHLASRCSPVEVMPVSDHLARIEELEAEREQWKRAATGDRDGVLTYEHHMQVQRTLVAERNRAEQALSSLRSKVEGALVRELNFFPLRERLQRILDETGERDG